MDKKQLLDRFLSSVERKAFVMAKISVADREEALDIVQDTMMKLVQRYSHKPENQWRPLFFKILESRIVDWHRRHQVRSRWRVWLDRFSLSGSHDEHKDHVITVDHFADKKGEEPYRVVSEKEGVGLIREALQSLPVRQQQAFLLRAWEGLNVAETAIAMGCSQGSVKTHYSRANQKLQQLLVEKGVCGEHER